MLVGVFEEFAGENLIEPAADIQSPQRFQRQPALMIEDRLAEHRHHERIAAFGENAPRSRRCQSLE